MASHGVEDLVQMMGEALGVDKARKVVEEAARSKGLSGELTVAEAKAIMELIAATPGMVGTIARFAQSRIILVWNR